MVELQVISGVLGERSWMQAACLYGGEKFHNVVGQTLELVGNISLWQCSEVWMRPGAGKI